MTVPSQTMAPALDAAHVSELETLLGEDFPVLLGTYRKDLEAKRALLAAAWQDRNLATLGECAHSLKGASLNLGVPGIATLCQALERDARGGNANSLDGLLRQLDDECERVIAALDGGEWR